MGFGSSLGLDLGFFGAVTTPAPIVSSISRNAGPQAGGTNVTITGSHFTGATSAALGGTNIASFLVVNDTTITGVSGAAGAVSALGTVTVTGPGGTGTKSSAWTYLPNDAIWLRADLGVTNVGGKASAWAGSGVGAHTATQGTAGNRPTIDLGETALDFDGSTSWMRTDAIDLSATNKVTIFWAGKIVFTAGTEILFEFGTGIVGVAGSFNNNWQVGGGGLLAGILDGTSGTYAEGDTVVAGFASVMQYNMILDRSLAIPCQTLRYNRAAQTPTSTGTATSVTGNFGNYQLNIGSRNAGNSLFFDGKLKEILITPRSESLAVRQAVETYMQAQWGTP